MKKEQFAVYEKEPAHGKDEDCVILAPFDTKEEAEQARLKYGYGEDNYYVDKVGKRCFEVYFTDNKSEKEGKINVWLKDVEEVEPYFEKHFPHLELYDIGEC